MDVLDQGRIIDDSELKQQLAAGKPYKEWIKRIRIKLADLPAAGDAPALGHAQHRLARMRFPDEKTSRGRNTPRDLFLVCR